MPLDIKYPVIIYSLPKWILAQMLLLEKAKWRVAESIWIAKTFVMRIWAAFFARNCNT